MRIYFVGGLGTDAPGWYIGPDGKVHPVPGWNPESMVELTRAVNIIRQAGQLKTPGLGEAVIKSVMEFTQKELGEHIKGGGVLVIG